MSLSIFAAAAEAPDRPALITDNETLTFADLARRVRDAVARLRARGLESVGSGTDGPDPVAIVAGNDLPTLVTVHALIALGTPALLLHPRLTAAERQGSVESAGASGAARPGRRRGDDVGGRREWAERADVADPEDLESAPHASADPPPPPDDDRPLAIIHTSGTSGRPRGVVLSRRAFAASAAASAANLGWRDDDRWLLPLPVAHVGGLSILTRCLLARRAVVLAPGTEPAALLDSLRRHRVTLLSVVPTLLARILDRDTPTAPPEHLRAVLLGGAGASPALLERAADAGWPVLTTYGLTEACSQVTTQRYGTVNRGELGSGSPLPGIELRIGDDDGIQVRGPTLLSGYLPPTGSSPFLDDGWLPTGDRGRLDDAGNLHVLGRRTDRIITGGENVDPVEVERALERLPTVRQACVFGTPDQEWGEVVSAAVVVETPDPATASPTGSAPDLLETIRGLRDVLAPFKLPRRVAVLESLPVNTLGKLDRRETARRAERSLRQV